MLYAEIADEVETADTGDGLWLDWALAVLDECEELAALVLKDLLLDVTTDYRLEPRELKRIRAVAGGDDHKQALDRLLSDGEASLPDLIRQVLAAAIQYRQLAEAHDQAYFGIDS
jgi:hypothetical protein